MIITKVYSVKLSAQFYVFCPSLQISFHTKRYMLASGVILNTELEQLRELIASEKIQEAMQFIFLDMPDLPLHAI